MTPRARPPTRCSSGCRRPCTDAPGSTRSCCRATPAPGLATCSRATRYGSPQATSDSATAAAPTPRTSTTSSSGRTRRCKRLTVQCGRSWSTCTRSRRRAEHTIARSLRAMPSTQDQVYARWRNERERFWAEAADSVHWYRRWNRVLDASRPPYYRWFSGGVVNTCYNALDRHVASGRGDQPALIYDSPVAQTITCFTYRTLLDQVSRFAGVLKGQGVGRGDRVIIYMPMVPAAALAMLACARIGAIHSVVFGGFASHELAARISHAAPKVVVSASCGIEVNRVVPYKPLLDKAIELATVKPSRCIVLQRPQERAPLVPGRDVDWSELMAGARAAGARPGGAAAPPWILYTSRATRMAKGGGRHNGGGPPPPPGGTKKNFRGGARGGD